jgi:hypothetical protein
MISSLRKHIYINLPLKLPSRRESERGCSELFDDSFVDSKIEHFKLNLKKAFLKKTHIFPYFTKLALRTKQRQMLFSFFEAMHKLE